MDQTVRTALGLSAILDQPVEHTGLKLHPLRCSIRDRLSNWASGLIGRRYLLLRISQPEPRDIEKRLCRVTADDLLALGTDPGAKLVLFAPRRSSTGYELARASLQALPLSESAIDRRRKVEKEESDQGWDARYRNSPQLLRIDGTDLSDIFVDRDARTELEVESSWPILVRRSSSSAAFREVLEFGVLLLATTLALQGVVSPLIESAEWSPALRGLATIVLAVGLAIAGVAARLRSDLR